MHKIMFLCYFVAFFATNCFAKSIKINPANAVIVLPFKADRIKQFASNELAKHLKLITGKSIPIVKDKAPAGKYAFMIGFNAKAKKLAPEQAVFTVGPKKTWLFGEDSAGRGKNLKAVATNKKSRTGTLFAVYLFLEKELGIKWLKPDDDGIVFTPCNELTLKTGTTSWTPKLQMRYIRSGYSKKTVNASKDAPVEFRLSKAQRAAKRLATDIWLKRMKMGRSEVFEYGHAFKTWWKKYSKKHPEYFALRNGKRTLYKASRPDWVKLCITNPEVHKLIIKNFIKTRNGSTVINTCANDCHAFCECPKCRALDATRKGEKFDENMTDRYIWFANHLQALARKQVPEAKSIMYAYSVYRYPPRKIRVADGMIIGFVPKLLDDNLDAYYKSWKKAGAKKLFLRPNDMFIDPGLPMGFEKRMFDNFQTCMKYGAFGTDYDSIHNFWPVSGIANYIIARAVAEPEKTFKHWENEYCSTYGAAAPGVKKYYQYWRNNIWAKKLMPDKEMIMKKGRFGNFRRGLMWNLYRYYTDADFDKTDSYLKTGLKKQLLPSERKRLELLLLSNQHSRLTFEAMRAKYQKPQNVKKLVQAANKLLSFRKKYRKKLDFNWEFLFSNEVGYGDVCGLKMTTTLQGLQPIAKLPTKWFFKIDPKNAGLKEKWQDSSWKKVTYSWDYIHTNTFWERAKCPPELHKELKNYNGIGWYARRFSVPANLKGKKLYLIFGAVDESCEIFINGKLAGKHLFQKPDDWKTPFKIRIDQVLSEKTTSVILVVRVEDKSGAGGIWQPVWLGTNK
jgi:Domain of unknown function (DUF4838)/Glycosyl hydrolases family 2, sugar binding domain